MINLAALSIGSNLLVQPKEISDLNIKSSGKFDDRREREAALATESATGAP
jgi:hypothetical protein